MNIGQAFLHGNPVVMAVFIFLAAMSFVSWYIIFWKGMMLFREYRAYNNFRAKFVNTVDWSNHKNFMNVDGGIKFLLAEVKKLETILPLYITHEAKKEILAMHLTQALDDSRLGFDKGLTVLASIGSSSPFIGLFGTVWGIYNALSNIAIQGNAGLSVVAGPMGEALIATAIGLFAAIPAVLAYNSFVRLNRLLVQNLRHIAEQITVYLSNEAQKHKN